MKKSELRQLIKEELKNTHNEGLTSSLMDRFKNKTGPQGLIMSHCGINNRHGVKNF